MMPIAPVFISPDWLTTKHGQEAYASLLHKGHHTRKSFGLLERPLFNPQLSLDEYEYKIFISGKSGVGKTSTVAKLSANEIPATHSETPGIQTSCVYWPALVSSLNKVILFKLQIWDAGENVLKKFDHILPACKEKVDGVIFTFSFADKSSFEDLPQQMSRINAANDNFCRFITGTKLDVPQSEVTQRDVEEFENAWKLPILGVQNSPDHHQQHASSGGDYRAELKDIAPLMNYVCDELWKRDQILATGSANVGGTTGKSQLSFY